MLIAPRAAIGGTVFSSIGLLDLRPSAEVVRIRQTKSQDLTVSFPISVSVPETLGLQLSAVLGPRHAVQPRGRISLQREVCLPEKVHRHVVHQVREPKVPIPSCRLSYPGQSTRRFRPVLRPARGRLFRISLGHQPFLPPVRSPTDHATRPAAGGGFPAPLFRLRGASTVPP